MSDDARPTAENHQESEESTVVTRHREALEKQCPECGGSGYHQIGRQEYVDCENCNGGVLD